MIPLLPNWNLNPNRSSFYDRDAGTLLELAAKLHASMNELIEDYNNFVESVTNNLNGFEAETTEQIELVKTGLRQEFQDFIDAVDIRIQHIETNVSSDYIDELADRIYKLEQEFEIGLAQINSALTELVGEQNG